MKSTTYFYCCIDLDGETRHQHTVYGSWSFADGYHAQKLAQEAADDYHSNHGAWEARWPLVFAIYGSEAGPEQARLSVDMEARPHFTARPILKRAEDMTPNDLGLSHWPC